METATIARGEASPGPGDHTFLFDKFLEMVRDYK